MTALATLSRMLGVAPRLAEDALHSEGAARAALSRRNLFAAGAAMATGSLLVGGPLPLLVFHDDCTWYAAHSWADYRELLKEQCGWKDDDEDLAETLAYSTETRLSDVVSVCWDPAEREITDSGHHTLRASFDFWAKREGRGILFGSEY
jgi:hypothetical protein